MQLSHATCKIAQWSGLCNLSSLRVGITTVEEVVMSFSGEIRRGNRTLEASYRYLENVGANNGFYSYYGQCRILNVQRSKKIFIAIRRSDDRYVALKVEEISNREIEAASQVFDSI
ncbi:unnamed protein product [Wuchereria bancrofti]|uniref:Uncharacterized protein n=1 Tax=Wuchereria bancrofti TaxID=6293 RepID=A0A3P7DFC8_WUCBA|nr:unnamed protein product [Wuchereria bancrofti]